MKDWQDCFALLVNEQVNKKLGNKQKSAVYCPSEKASGSEHSDLLFSSLITRSLTTDKTALELNWQQVFSLVDQLADQLFTQGLTAGQGLALIGKNSLLQLLLYLAGLSLGARVMVINPQFPSVKIERVLRQNQLNIYFSTIELVFEDSEFKTATKRYLPAAVEPDFIDYHRTSPHLWQQGLSMTLTSGSSGEPKAVVHDLQAHWQNALGVNEFLDFTEEKSWLLSLPLYHVSGQGIVWRWLSSGACLHFSSEDFYASVGQVTHVSLVPTQLQRYLHYLTEQQAVMRDRIQTQAILLGGAHIHPELCRQAENLGLTTFSGYGMTEMASTVFISKNNRSNSKINPEVRLLRGRELCIHHGEIWLRGAGLARGYWRQGKIELLLNSQGWYQTKDSGRWQNGQLEVLGRIDNMFISGGENIQPEEIENVLRQHSQIEQVYILPLSDVEFGARPVAMVQFKQGFSTQLVEQVRFWLHGKIERFKQPIAYYPLPSSDDDQQIKVSRKQLLQTLQQQLSGMANTDCERDKI